MKHSPTDDVVPLSIMAYSMWQLARNGMQVAEAIMNHPAAEAAEKSLGESARKAFSMIDEYRENNGDTIG